MGRVKQAVLDKAMRIESRLDLANLIGSNTNEKPWLAGLRKIETDDEALLDALESFESLELSTAVAQPQEITAAESTVSAEDTVVESLKTVDLIDPDKTTNDPGVLPLNDTASVNRIDEVNIKKILQTVASPTVSQLVESESESESEDKDQFKVIGALKIGIPLYNVYLNEADEWSRCLVTELDEWAIEFHKPLSISTVNFAHSLAGSSAAVGFFQLSSLAKQLESALDKVFQHKNGTETEAVIFAQVAEECRRLLHQFAAGFLKEPKVSVVGEPEIHAKTFA
jgi:chemosensory pili system protein ChpA (sensor histidine kinase/response regulator)